MCLCHSDQSRDEKRSPILQVNKRIFHVYLMQHSLKQTFWCVQSFFFLSAVILFLHILFISFLSVDSATSKNIWVHYTVVAAQRNAVFFAPKDSRRKLYEICKILSIISLFKFKISFDLKVFLNNSFLSQITCIIVL